MVFLHLPCKRCVKLLVVPTDLRSPDFQKTLEPVVTGVAAGSIPQSNGHPPRNLRSLCQEVRRSLIGLASVAGRRHSVRAPPSGVGGYRPPESPDGVGMGGSSVVVDRLAAPDSSVYNCRSFHSVRSRSSVTRRRRCSSACRCRSARCRSASRDASMAGPPSAICRACRAMSSAVR